MFSDALEFNFAMVVNSLLLADQVLNQYAPPPVTMASDGNNESNNTGTASRKVAPPLPPRTKLPPTSQSTAITLSASANDNSLGDDIVFPDMPSHKNPSTR